MLIILSKVYLYKYLYIILLISHSSTNDLLAKPTIYWFQYLDQDFFSFKK